MNIFRDKQIKHFSLFIAIYSILLVGVSTWFSINQLNTAKSMYLEHDRAIVSALLEQEVSKEVIANAISSTDISTAGMEFLDNLGITTNTFGSLLPHFSQFQYHFLRIALGGGICLVIILVIGVISFLQIRNNLYRQSGKIIDNYINNDYSCHLPQDSEGDLFHLFASVEQLATMLKAKSETEHKTKEFLKSTISDISHQLKTPLAALMMYQEIIEAEPDNTETVKKFSQKTGTALKRIEQLILSMLKIARLDTGNILFDKRTCLIQELVKNAISELTIRATQEKKQIIVNGTSNQVIMCDMDWTSEAIGNLVKNALDHTEIGGIVKITWESTPTMIRILVSQLKFLYPLKTLAFPAFSPPRFGPFPSFFPLREEMRETFFRPSLQPYPEALRKFAWPLWWHGRKCSSWYLHQNVPAAPVHPWVLPREREGWSYMYASTDGNENHPYPRSFFGSIGIRC